MSELGAPVASSIPEQLPGHEPASARKGCEDTLVLRNVRRRWGRSPQRSTQPGDRTIAAALIDLAESGPQPRAARGREAPALARAKRLELLHEVVPGATTIAALVNPANPVAADETRELKESARALGLQLHIANAGTGREVDAAFATWVQQRVGAVIVTADAFFTSRRDQLVVLTARHALPAISQWREFATAGFLMSYGTSLSEAYRQAAVYVGRILKGEKPGDLPVQQAPKVELVINLNTARALGISFPLPLLGRADEVIA